MITSIIVFNNLLKIVEIVNDYILNARYIEKITLIVFEYFLLNNKMKELLSPIILVYVVETR